MVWHEKANWLFQQENRLVHGYLFSSWPSMRQRNSGDWSAMSWPAIASWLSCRLQFSLKVPEHVPDSWWCAPRARGFRSHSFGSQWLCSLMTACMIPMVGAQGYQGTALADGHVVAHMLEDQRSRGLEDTCADYQRLRCWWALRRGLAVPMCREKHIMKYPLRTENYIFYF